MREQHIHVNIGLGETIFPARIGARPEMTMITLRRKQGYPESTAVNHEDIYKEKALTKESEVLDFQFVVPPGLEPGTP